MSDIKQRISDALKKVMKRQGNKFIIWAGTLRRYYPSLLFHENLVGRDFTEDEIEDLCIRAMVSELARKPKELSNGPNFSGFGIATTLVYDTRFFVASTASDFMCGPTDNNSLYAIADAVLKAVKDE